MSLAKQRRIQANTVKRGYRDGWTAEQFLLRQLAILQEESAETFLTARWLLGSANIQTLYERVNDLWFWSKLVFKKQNEWHPAPYEWIDFAQMRAEMADVVVVLCNLAGAIEEITGEPVDLMQEALDKSAQDVERGTDYQDV